jgi:hypothetical protein
MKALFAAVIALAGLGHGSSAGTTVDPSTITVTATTGAASYYVSAIGNDANPERKPNRG